MLEAGPGIVCFRRPTRLLRAAPRKRATMADLEAVLADVSYLMAMEKSKVQGGNTGGIGRRKINLPDVR